MASPDKTTFVGRWLGQTNTAMFSIYTALAAFSLYTCVYAFRKTFAVATFDGIQYWGVDYKNWLVIFQVMGYAASKFVGIKVIAELQAKSRAIGILLMVAIAGLSWLLFAVVPAPYNILCLFMNGFPLGLVWGMVFGYLEGRRNTDFLGAALAVSFIFSAGLCKSVGGYIMRDWHVSETWMPLTAAMVFVVPLLVSLWLLNQVPPPNARDEELRTKRQPMSPEERIAFIKQFFFGLFFLIALYIMLTAFRDFRDNFAADIWKSLGYSNPEIFTTTEVPVSIACLIVIGGIVVIKDNKLALEIIHILILLGTVLTGVATYAFQQQWISPPLWMTFIGLGLYLGYIPFNSSFFDRMLATFKITGTVGFVMYVADSIGYLGSVVVVLYKQFGQGQLSLLEFFLNGSYVLSVVGSVMVVASMIYFRRKYQRSLA